MTCKHCGAPLPQDALICPVCGKAQDSVSQEVENQVQAALDQAQAALNGSAAQDSHNDSHPEEAAPPEDAANNSASREQAAPSGWQPEDTASAGEVPPEPEAIPLQEQPNSSSQDETRDFSYSQEEEEVDPAAPIYTQRRKGRSFPRQEEDPSVPTTGQYFFMQLIMRLPIIGFIVSLFWGLSDSGSPHRRNLARANILLSLLGLVVSLALIGILMGILSTIMAALMSYGSYYNDYPEYFGDFFGHGDGYYDYYDDYYDDYYGYYGEYPYYFNSAPSA